MAASKPENGATDVAKVLSPKEEAEKLKRHSELRTKMAQLATEVDALNKELGPTHAKKIEPALDSLQELIDASVINSEIRKKLVPKLIKMVSSVDDKYEMKKIVVTKSKIKTTAESAKGVDVDNEKLLSWMKNNASDKKYAKSKNDIEKAMELNANQKFKQNQWDKFKKENKVKSDMKDNNKRDVKYHL